MTELTSRYFWAAGLIEGEGYFGCDPRRAETRPGKGRSKGPPRFLIGVEMKDREPLEKLQRLFGGLISRRPARYDSWSQTYVWRTSGARALGIAFTLYGLLSPRRKKQIRTKEALCRLL